MITISFFSPKSGNSIDSPNQFRADKNKPKGRGFRLPFTTAVVQIDTAQRMAMVYIKAIVDNQDPTNNLLVRTDPDAEQLIVPPNSVITIEDELHSFIQVTPNAGTGVGLISLTVADEAELRRDGFLGL